MARHRDASKQQRWLDLMRRQQQSQLTVREFCERHGLSEANFYVWRRVLRDRDLLDDQSTPASPMPTSFVELTADAAPASATAVDVVLSERRLLRVHPGFDPGTVLQLVRLLEEPAC
jgi:transposase-like protein